MRLWCEGSTQAIRKFLPSVQQELKKSVVKSNYKVYRGYKFDEEGFTRSGSSIEDLLGCSFESMEIGKTAEINCSTLTSWTKSEKVAKEFSNPRFNSIENLYFSDEDITEIGYDYGDILGLSVVLEADIPADYVLADLTKISNVSHGHEAEIIVRGKFPAKILHFETVVHNPETSFKGDSIEDELPSVADLTDSDKERIRKSVLESMGWEAED